MKPGRFPPDLRGKPTRPVWNFKTLPGRLPEEAEGGYFRRIGNLPWISHRENDGVSLFIVSQDLVPLGVDHRH